LSKLKILHITPWYPTSKAPQNAPWIRQHVEALNAYTSSHVLHVHAHAYGNEKINESTEDVTHVVRGKKGWPWRFTEILAYRLLVRELKNINASTAFDLVNFHIAYPHLIHLRMLKKHLPKKIVVTEHWSYYHYHFHSSKELKRIKNIFKGDFKLICVSERLRADIEGFCGYPIKAEIVPNVASPAFIEPVSNTRDKTILMGSYWKSPKRPELVLEAFLKLVKNQSDWQLEIFGDGPLVANLKSTFTHQNIHWLGRLDSAQIADKMRRSSCFAMPSDYETFSVVTAEALCCGCAIVVSENGALPEFINDDNGILVKQQEWEKALTTMTTLSWNHQLIAQQAQSKFNAHVVAKKYLATLAD
jgi:L-malate glycosyltransferase